MTLLRMAASYRQSADLLRVRIIALKDELARTEDPKERRRSGSTGPRGPPAGGPGFSYVRYAKKIPPKIENFLLTNGGRCRLEQRIKDLNTLYRETREAALVMERYYDRRYHKHGRHTR